MMQSVVDLANEHHIFVSVEPVIVGGWALKFKYKIQEPEYDRFIYRGYGMPVTIESEHLYDEYNDALSDALDYVKDNARRVGENDGYLTLIPKDKWKY